MASKEQINQKQIIAIIDQSKPQFKEQVYKLFKNHLYFPTLEQANHHFQANRLGIYDLVTSTTKKEQILDKQIETAICKCCGLLKQPHEQELQQLIDQCGEWHWFRTEMSKITNIGQSTRLYFYNLEFFIMFWLISFLVYGFYSIVTNITSAIGYSIPCFQTKMCNLSLIALGSKLQNSYFDLYIAQAWLGLAMVIVWTVLFVFKSYRQRKIEIQQDDIQKTCSDFAVLIENLPQNIKTKQELQIYLQDYLQNPQINQYVSKKTSGLTFNGKQYIETFEIYNLNIARNFQQLSNVYQQVNNSDLMKEFKKSRNEIISWIKNYFEGEDLPLSPQERQVFYQGFHQLGHNLVKERKQIIKKYFTHQHKDGQQIHTNVAFVTFKYNISRMLLTKLHRNELTHKIKRVFRGKPRIQIRSKTLQIERAPQPLDIIWQNVGHSECFIVTRKLLTYFLTLLVLGVSFLGIYYLSVFQNNTQNSVLSLLVSIFITLVNAILAQIIQYLTVLEKDFRSTYYQINVAIKTTLAQITNSVILTMIADYYIKGNIYSEGGLADDVFYLALSNMFVPSILKIFDPYYFYLILMRWYYSKPHNRFAYESQKEYNQLFEGYQFEVGLYYVYILNTSLYTAFFISMQPVIALMAPVGFLLMYLVQKYTLFHRCARPKPSSNIINESLNQILYLTIITYALGSLTWTNFLPNGKPFAALIPNVIALGVGGFLILFPIQQIMESCIKDTLLIMDYEQERILILDEYQRRNPATSKKGMKNYIEFLKKSNASKSMDGVFKYFAIGNNFEQNQENNFFNELANNFTQQYLIKPTDQTYQQPLNPQYIYPEVQMNNLDNPNPGINQPTNLFNILGNLEQRQVIQNNQSPQTQNYLQYTNANPQSRITPKNIFLNIFEMGKKHEKHKIATSKFNLVDYQFEEEEYEHKQNRERTYGQHPYP